MPSPHAVAIAIACGTNSRTAIMYQRAIDCVYFSFPRPFKCAVKIQFSYWPKSAHGETVVRPAPLPPPITTATIRRDPSDSHFMLSASFAYGSAWHARARARLLRTLFFPPFAPIDDKHVLPRFLRRTSFSLSLFPIVFPTLK